MIPILTPAEMKAVDDAAPESVEQLIDRAARAVARTAVEMMGGSYGRRVAVVAGPGNNGADGRVASRHLGRRGVRCRIYEVADGLPRHIGGVDLVIDAAFGTGLTRPFSFPTVDVGVAVLAVDIPSGVDGLTGQLLGSPVRADRTVTFAALKPGIVLEPGRSLAGEVTVVDIGLDIAGWEAVALEAADLAAVLPRRPADDHKWRSAVRVIGGSPSMTGAACLAARAAQRVGAGLVQLALPGGSGNEGPIEAVGHLLPATGWGPESIVGADRLQALLVGPGLGPDQIASVGDVLAVDRPLVVDGDALQPEIIKAVSRRRFPTILTPHDGEWARLGGSLDPDRIKAVHALAAATGDVVVRKGPTTLIGAPGEPVRVVTTGTAALATAGTGDVLAGLILGLLARGLAPVDAASAGAQIHAAAAALAPSGLIAGDLIDRIPAVLASCSRALGEECHDHHR